RIRRRNVRDQLDHVRLAVRSIFAGSLWRASSRTPTQLRAGWTARAGCWRSEGLARANSQRGLSVPGPHRQHPCDGQEDGRNRTALDLNDLVRAVLQLHQVLINLITNAI